MNRRDLLKSAAATGAALLLPGHFVNTATQAATPTDELPQLLGHRFVTFNAVVRVNQIEVSRDRNAGEDESPAHTLKQVRTMRRALEKGFPGGRMTWAFSWLALQDRRQNYQDIRKEVADYCHRYGDEATFIPGGYFAPMYNSRAQVNRDLHDALKMVSDMVGGGYRPRSVVAGFLAADNLRYLAEEEGIHVAQGNIWSQYAVDNGDGDGSICYPYYPSQEHFCKAAQGKSDFIDCVNLDGWTVDFLCGRRKGGEGGFNSRMGVGPLETLFHFGLEKGLRQMVETTGFHFDAGFKLNQFAWVTNCWEASLVPKYIEGLTQWLSEIRRRWSDTLCVTQGEFGLAWRKQFPNNDELNYRFVERGTGIDGSDADKQIRWLMNRDFRLALLRNWKTREPEQVIDFTRYDLPAKEPPDASPNKPIRNWSLMNRINQKRSRPQDQPISLAALPLDDRELIQKHYPKLFLNRSA
jgi:hypothetical protein